MEKEKKSFKSSEGEQAKQNRRKETGKGIIRTIMKEVPEMAYLFLLLAMISVIAFFTTMDQRATRKRYGFIIFTPDLKWFPCHLEPIMIRWIVPGGAFDKAGFKDRDIMLLPENHSIRGFMELLEKPAGTLIELESIPWENFRTDCNPGPRGTPEKRIVVAP